MIIKLILKRWKSLQQLIDSRHVSPSPCRPPTGFHLFLRPRTGAVLPCWLQRAAAVLVSLFFYNIPTRAELLTVCVDPKRVKCYFVFPVPFALTPDSLVLIPPLLPLLTIHPKSLSTPYHPIFFHLFLAFFLRCFSHFLAPSFNPSPPLFNSSSPCFSPFLSSHPPLSPFPTYLQD